MAYNRFYDSIRPIYEIVKDSEFSAYDVPQEYRKQLRWLEFDGYLVKTGYVKEKRYTNNYRRTPQWRIARRYLDLLNNNEW